MSDLAGVSAEGQNPTPATSTNFFQTTPETKVVTIEPDNLPETIVDGVLSVTVVNGMPRLNFYAERLDQTPCIRRVLVARLAMSIETSKAIVNALSGAIHTLQGDGAFQPLQQKESFE
jgi:hypothetical protein